MAIDLYLDPATGDLGLTSDLDAALVEGRDEIKQNTTIQLRTHRGSVFGDPVYGIPYREVVFVRNPNNALIANVVKGILRARPDFLDVGPVIVGDPDASRKSSIVFTAETSEGLLSSTELEI